MAFLFEGERKAEWLGNDNRKTMIKAKTIGQIQPFKSGTALPSPSQPGWAYFIFIHSDYYYYKYKTLLSQGLPSLS